MGSERSGLGVLVVLLVGLPLAASGAEGSGSSGERTTTPLMRSWKFVQNDGLTEQAALSSSASDWQPVNLPHSWNAKDAASTNATVPYKRGIGWYRLEFGSPAAGGRKWLEFGAASVVADVWLNGKKLGRHKGAFTAFRFDVTNQLLQSGRNVLLVRVDNRAPSTKDDPTAIVPLAGDFNYSGGLYRHVALISTADPVHFDLDDLGGPGIYASTVSIDGKAARVAVRARLKNDSANDDDLVVRATLMTAEGQVAKQAEKQVRLRAGEAAEVTQALAIDEAHLWQGVEDPYQYKLRVELVRGGEAVDTLSRNFGIRQTRFDPDRGFFLNGKPVRLRGVAMHQDFQGKGWAVTDQEFEESLSLVTEIGANSVRLGHYPFPEYVLDRLDSLGLIAWAEVPFGIGVTVEAPLTLGKRLNNCPDEDPTPELRANARLQLQEMIRQQYNHASIAMWSVGNETTFLARECPTLPYDNVTSLLRELNALAKLEDPNRATTLADLTERVIPAKEGRYIAVGGITDVWAVNQYFLWYGGPVSELGALLDALHARYPSQPLGVSEYGGGAALTHHTDNPRGGPIESTNTGQPVVYQPEEYASYLHEQNYAMLSAKPYLWGTYVWNMFDFGSGIRNEGDMRGVNTKGLVTFDRKTRKDPFYFYKANWSRTPVTYLTSKRYTQRAYPLVDVKVYSNADSIELTVNGSSAGKLEKKDCLQSTCVFRGVRLRKGDNTVSVKGDHQGNEQRDSVVWSLGSEDINIAAGQLESGFGSKAKRFGSDQFFIGGRGNWLVEKGTEGATDTTPVRGGDADLFRNYRHGQFSYFVPLPNGDYEVTLGFLEPDRNVRPGQRVFDVVANGKAKLEQLDVVKAAGQYRTAITRTFTTTVSGGELRLDFTPILGEPVLSNIAIHQRTRAARRPSPRD